MDGFIAYDFCMTRFAFFGGKVCCEGCEEGRGGGIKSNPKIGRPAFDLIRVLCLSLFSTHITKNKMKRHTS